jgi:Ca-activated chloride channel family protein
LKRYKPFIILILLSFGIVSQGWAQTKEKPAPPENHILFIFDASQSMYGYWESDRKINIARKYLIQLIDSLEKINNVKLALRVYGHQKDVPPQDCNDTKLEVPFKANNSAEIRQKLRYLIPRGTTPIANSLTLAENDFPSCENCRNIIILITDGVEACDGDPCQASLTLQKKGIILKPFIIGIGIDPNFEKTFECVGQFYNTPNEQKFSEVLEVVITRALNATSAQVNLLDIYGKPTETDVNMTFFDSFSGKVRYNFVHSINYKGNPDTLFIDPLVSYNIVVQTLPAVVKNDVSLSEGKHNMIGIDAPQGSLNIFSLGNNQYKDLKILIKEAGKAEILNIQTCGQTEKYIVGNYDLEVLTLPRLVLKDIKIEQSTTTKIEIPKPGIANFSIPSSGFASLYQETSDTLKWVYNFEQQNTRPSLVLQPGDYRIVYRPKNVKESIYTIKKRFTIKSGSSNTIILL